MMVARRNGVVVSQAFDVGTADVQEGGAGIRRRDHRLHREAGADEDRVELAADQPIGGLEEREVVAFQVAQRDVVGGEQHLRRHRRAAAAGAERDAPSGQLSYGTDLRALADQHVDRGQLQDGHSPQPLEAVACSSSRPL